MNDWIIAIPLILGPRGGSPATGWELGDEVTLQECKMGETIKPYSIFLDFYFGIF